MSDLPPQGDPYEAVLADLRGKIAQLQQAVAAIEAIRAGQPLPNQGDSAGSQSPVGTQVTAGMFHGMSIVEAVKQLLAMRKKPMGTQEIMEAIREGGVVFSTDTPANTVGSVLHREASKPQGTVISVGRGTWALPGWYPNPGRFQKKGRGTVAEATPDSVEATALPEGEDVVSAS